MSVQVWILALALVLIIEGIGPMCFSKRWQQYLVSLAKIEPASIQRVGGVLVVIGVSLLAIFS